MLVIVSYFALSRLILICQTYGKSSHLIRIFKSFANEET